MQRAWLSLVLGAVSLIAWFVFMYTVIETFQVLPTELDLEYRRTVAPFLWVGMGVSLAVVILGLWARGKCDPRNRKARAQGWLGAALALLASMLWLHSALFLPYRF